MPRFTIAEIKAAHAMLLRGDSEYAARYEANKSRQHGSHVLNEYDAEFNDLQARNHLIETGGGRVNWTPQYRDGVLDSAVDSKRSNVLSNSKPKPGRAGLTYIHAGVELTMTQWCERTGLKKGTLRNRLKLGWSLADALTTPATPANATATRSTRIIGKTYAYNGQDMTLQQLAEVSGMNRNTLRNRLKRGWSVEAAMTIAAGEMMGCNAHGGGWIKTSETASGTARYYNCLIAPNWGKNP